MNTIPPDRTLRRMIYGYQLSMAIAVFARLRLADHMAGISVSLQVLQAASKTHSSSLERLLLYLVDFDFLQLNSEGEFALTEISELLVSDAPDSYRDIASLPTFPWHWNAWGALCSGVKSGGTPFEESNGKPLFDYLSEYPDDAEFFNRLMGSDPEVNKSIAAALDIPEECDVLDIGGGRGTLLAEILKHKPHAHGLLYDLPSTSEAARQMLTEVGLSGRTKVLSGNFFESVPEAKIMVLRWILHDWSDEKAIAILSNCASSLSSGGKIYIVEYIIPDQGMSPVGRTLDLSMLVSTGGQERTLAQFESLLDRSGLKLLEVSTIETRLPFSLLEAVLP